MRKRPKPEEVFYNTLVNLIKNQLINDPNFKGETMWEKSWYEKNNKMHYGLFKEKAKYILGEIESLKHLILWEEDEEYKTIPDIRNKLTPITNMIALFERGETGMIKLEEVKKSINYLCDREVYELP